MISEASENAINPSLAKAFNMKEREKPKTKQKQKRPHVSRDWQHKQRLGVFDVRSGRKLTLNFGKRELISPTATPAMSVSAKGLWPCSDAPAPLS